MICCAILAHTFATDVMATRVYTLMHPSIVTTVGVMHDQKMQVMDYSV